MDGMKEDVQNFQRFQSFGPPRIANYGISSSDEQLPGSGFGNHSNQYDYTDPGKSVWSFGLYCTIQEDLNLKSWPHFESCKKIWEKMEGRQKVDRGIFTSFADVVRKREDIGTERDRGDNNNYMSSSRSTISDQLNVKHHEHTVRRSVKASAARSKRIPPCLFQYDDPISEELSLSLEPISSSSSHFSSDCDGENNDGIYLSSLKISKADRDSRYMGERKKQPLLHPRMSTPSSNSSVLSKRRYPPTCHFPYEDSCLEGEDASLEPVSSSSSHFSDVDLELSEIAYLQGRISTIAYANTPPSTTSQDCAFRSTTSQRTLIAQLNISPPQPSAAAKDVPVKENVTERNGSQMHHLIFPSTEFPTLTSASNPLSAKTPDSGKIPKLMEIKLDMKDKLDMNTSPLSSESKALENGLLKMSSLPNSAKYDETNNFLITNGDKGD